MASPSKTRAGFSRYKESCWAMAAYITNSKGKKKKDFIRAI
jgi:hypothetical protein